MIPPCVNTFTLFYGKSVSLNGFIRKTNKIFDIEIFFQHYTKQKLFSEIYIFYEFMYKD